MALADSLKNSIQIPDAEDAKVTQKKYKKDKKTKDRFGNVGLGKQVHRLISVFAFFCVFCATFASSASGCLVFFFRRFTKEKRLLLTKEQQTFEGRGQRLKSSPLP